MTSNGLGQVEDQPAHAARQRGLDPPPQLAALVQRARDVDLVHDVVEPMLVEDHRARLRYGTQGLRGEHGWTGARGATRAYFPRGSGRQACNCTLT